MVTLQVYYNTISVDESKMSTILLEIFSCAGQRQTTDTDSDTELILEIYIRYPTYIIQIHRHIEYDVQLRTVMMTCPLLSSANVIAMYVWYEISPYLSQFLEGTTTCILVILYSHEWTSQCNLK